jgi:hypothetical protein
MKIYVGAYPGESPEDCVQRICDSFYVANGPCCAGCDWWDSINSQIGNCTRSAPVSGAERAAMLGMRAPAYAPGAGHVMTKREHVCGDFKDEFDWSSLSPLYLRRIGKSEVPA